MFFRSWRFLRYSSREDAALWVVYHRIVGSYAGVVGQGLSFVFHVIYVVRHGKERKKKRSS